MIISNVLQVPFLGWHTLQYLPCQLQENVQRRASNVPSFPQLGSSPLSPLCNTAVRNSCQVVKHQQAHIYTSLPLLCCTNHKTLDGIPILSVPLTTLSSRDQQRLHLKALSTSITSHCPYHLLHTNSLIHAAQQPLCALPRCHRRVPYPGP